MKKNPPINFWKRVHIPDLESCWEWSGHKDKLGYGKLAYRGKAWLAHRRAWFLTYGELAEDICVLHHCDNPCCCNPAHLFLGTRNDNNQDRHQKGRSRCGCMIGETNPQAKITRPDAEKIRQLKKDGQTYKQIAEQYPIVWETVRDIIKNKIWRTQQASNRARMI